MVGSSGWAFEAWKVCAHCKGTGDEPATPLPPNAPHGPQGPVARCIWCGHGRRPGYLPDRMLTLEELAQALKPLL